MKTVWVLLFALFVSACGGGKAKDASDSSSVKIEYVPIAVNWVKRVTKGKEGDEKQRATELTRKLADEMLSRMQASNEPLDSIAEGAVKAVLGPEAVKDPKRRKAVTVTPEEAGKADLPPDAKEALAAFAHKAKPGDVVDSALGSGPVIVVARAAR